MVPRLRCVNAVGTYGTTSPRTSRWSPLFEHIAECGDLSISPSGALAFAASLQQRTGGLVDVDDTGVWSNASGDFRLVARSGMHAPGTEAGEVFSEFSPVALINAADKVAFTARLNTSSQAAGKFAGLWAQDREGKLSLIVRAGQSFHLGPNDDRTVSQVWLSSVLDGAPVSCNENFTLAFTLLFSDGSQGVYTASLVSLPGDNDGVVDAADYVVCRKGLGTTYTQADFEVWRTHLGQTAGSGDSAKTVAVPEPGAALLFALAVLLSAARL